MQVSENRVLYFAVLAALVLHMAMVSPLSRWLNRSLVPQFAGESLEIDINEIQSNILPATPEKKDEIQPEPRIMEQAPVAPQPVPEKLQLVPETPPPVPEKLQLVPETPPPVPDEQQPVPDVSPPSLVKRVERPVPKKKKLLSHAGEKDSGEIEPDLPVLDQPQTESRETGMPEEKALEDRSTKQQEKSVESMEEQQSPLFVQEEETERLEKEAPPDEISSSFRDGKPEDTAADNLQYSMNSYQWRFDRFIDNWVVDIQRWWKAPIDYMTGKMPEGGDLWVQVHLARSGKLLSYRVMQSDVTPEMELRAIQALIGSLKRPELPLSFVEDKLVINWRFIYPPLRPGLRMRR